MKDSTRRIVLFIIVVIAGSVLVLFDIPAVVMIIGIIALAVIVLFINGSIHLPKLSARKVAGSKTKTAPGPGIPADVRTKKKWPLTRKAAPATKTSRAATQGLAQQIRFRTFRRTFFINVTGVFSPCQRYQPGRKVWQGKGREKKKIDEMLDGSIMGEVSDIRSLKEANPEMIPVTRKVIEDPFTTLVKEPINTELLDSVKEVDISSLSDINLDGGMEIPSFGDDISNLDVALDAEDDKITIDDDTDDEVANILAAHQDEIDSGEKVGESQIASDITNLEELDIGSIDLDEELEIDDELPEPEKPGVTAGTGRLQVQKEPETAVAEPFPVEKPKNVEDSMVAFSTGKGQDDDLMSSLKSDASKTKKESHASLIRDLKDVKVPVQDLETSSKDS